MINEEKPEEVAANIPKGWTHAPTVADLQQDLTDSSSYHDTQMAKINRWLDNLHVRGAAKPKKIKGRSQAQPKLILKHAEWRYAALSEPFLATADMFKVRGRTARDKKAAYQNQVILNYQWNNIINKVMLIDDYVRTGVDEGTVIIRVGWETQEEEVTETIPVFEYFPAVSGEEMQILQRAAILQKQDEYAFAAHVPEEIKEALRLTEAQGKPIFPKSKGSTTITETKLVVNQPTAEVCNTANVHIDPTCNGDLDKAGFVIYSFETPKAELSKESHYFNIDAIQFSTNSILNSPDHEVSDDSSFNFKDEARSKFVAYEYWGYWDVDGSGTLTPFVATWVGSTLIRMQESPFPDKKIPFVKVQYRPKRRDAYGEPDGELLEENQKTIGAFMRGAMDLMGRSANGQQGMRMDALDAINQRKFDAGENFMFNPSVDPRAAIIDFKYPEVPNSVGMMIGWQNSDAESLSGVKPYSGGLSGDSLGDTATGIRGVLDAASKREIGILRRFAYGIQQVAKKIIAMNAAFLSDEEIVRITDEEFVTIRREDLEGNFDLEVDISTAEEDNAKAQELAFMLQTMGNNMPPEMSKIILADIARLRKMPNLAKRVEDFEPAPDPLAQRRAELEIALLEADVMDKQASAQERMAKAQKAMSEAGNKQADTDNKNLDFLNKESGLEHQRELERQGEQAKGNMALEILKSELNPQQPKVS